MIRVRALSTFDRNPRRKLSRLPNNKQTFSLFSYFNFQLSTFDPEPKRNLRHTSNTQQAPSLFSYFNFQLSTFDPLLETHAH